MPNCPDCDTALTQLGSSPWWKCTNNNCLVLRVRINEGLISQINKREKLTPGVPKPDKFDEQ